MRRLFSAGIVLLALSCALAFAADIVFPTLTGRVVDNANLIDASTKQELTQKLAEYEKNSSIQLVVVTLDNLQGREIEEFGNQLGRTWGIGQKDTNNGVLLLVAQEERKVRIEVGYGLEGVLTDAISSNIIHSVILPEFKQGQFSEGIRAGTFAIIAALGNEYEMRETSPPEKRAPLLLVFLVFGAFFVLPLLFSALGAGHHQGRRGGFGGFGGGGFGGGGGGGFGGGGGGFGGGGASGGW